MSRMIKAILVCLILAALLMATFPANAAIETTPVSSTGITVASTEPLTYNIGTNDLLSDGSVQVELIAGGGNPQVAEHIGYVRVWNDADKLYVQYQVVDPTPGTNPADDWYLTITHLAVATSLDGIPQSKGKPVPGHFEYTYDASYSTQYTYEIPLKWAPGTPLYIAAHAGVVIPGGLTGLELALPDTATMSVTYPYTGGPAYFPTVTITNGGNLNGIYNGGWCVDTKHVIYENTPYTANVYSSYEQLPAGTVDYPENFDLVNWILNQNYVGKSGPAGAYTYGDVQRAIWQLLESTPDTSGLGPWNQANVDAILADAYANGENFVPGCNQIAAIVLVPTDTVRYMQYVIAQVTITGLGIPCNSQEDTAWGAIPTDNGFDYRFKDKNWATYFTYTVTPYA